MPDYLLYNLNRICEQLVKEIQRILRSAKETQNLYGGTRWAGTDDLLAVLSSSSKAVTSSLSKSSSAAAAVSSIPSPDDPDVVVVVVSPADTDDRCSVSKFSLCHVMLSADPRDFVTHIHDISPHTSTSLPPIGA